MYDFSVDCRTFDIRLCIDIWWKTWYKLMFIFIKEMFIALLSVCVIGSFGESLASNLKCVSLTINYVKLDKQLLI